MISEREREMFASTAHDDLMMSRFVTFETGRIGPHSYDANEQKARMEWARSKLTCRVLDVGTGTGYLLAEYPGPAVGIDANPYSANEAKRFNGRSNHEFYCVNVRMGLPFDDNSFDVISLCELLEHVRFTTAVYVLKEAFRCARQYCISTFPYMHEGEYFIPNVESHDHLWGCTQEMIERLVREAGGKIESFEEMSDRQFACVVMKKV